MKSLTLVALAPASSKSSCRAFMNLFAEKSSSPLPIKQPRPSIITCVKASSPGSESSAPRPPLGGAGSGHAIGILHAAVRTWLVVAAAVFGSVVTRFVRRPLPLARGHGKRVSSGALRR